MDEKTIQAIEAILRRGNDAKVRRKGGGYVVVEIKETIKLSPRRLWRGKGNRSQLSRNTRRLALFILTARKEKS